MSSAKKKNIRNGHRTHIKKLIGEYEGLITVPELNMTKIVAVQRSLVEKKDVVKKLDDEILDAIEEDHCYGNRRDISNF